MAEPTPVMRSWEVNGGQAQALGPWETQERAPQDLADALPPHVAAMLDQLPADEREQVLAQAREMAAQGADPLAMLLQGEETVQLDPDSPFGMADPDPDAAGESDYAAPTRAAGSTGSSRVDVESPLQTRAKAKAFAQLAAGLVAVVSGLLNARFRLDDTDETWLADKDDLQAMSNPAGRIIARHSPLPGGTDANDLSDGIGIAIGAAGYLMKNLRARAAAVRERRRVVPAEA